MKSLSEQLCNYAGYHRDRRNIATHFIGIPMIVFSVIVLLSRPHMSGFLGLNLSPALLACLAAIAYYLRLDRPLGLLMALILGVMEQAAVGIAQQSTGHWLTWGVGLFVLGWAIQAVGHVWEGRKPAFLDDVMGLMIGPLFVVCELLFILGMRRELFHIIEAKVGKTHGATR